jgi:hypothetical protein
LEEMHTRRANLSIFLQTILSSKEPWRARDPLAQSTNTASKEKGDTVAKAFERMYKESHPDGPYPQLEIQPKLEHQSLPKESTSQETCPRLVERNIERKNTHVIAARLV